MALKFVTRAARLLGFLVSPLLTAPAAAGELERGAFVATLRGDGPGALPVVDCTRHGAAGRDDERRVRR